MSASRVVREPIPPFTWTDKGLRWSVEIAQRIIDEIYETGAETSVLLGQLRTEEQQPVRFIAQERVPLVSNDFGELAPASLAHLEATAPGRARGKQTVGFVCPSRSALRHLVTSLGSRANLLPEQVLVLRATDGNQVQGVIWEPAATSITSLELEFPLEMAPQPEPGFEPVAAMPPSGPHAVTGRPQRAPMAVKVEVPQWVWAAGLAILVLVGGAALWQLRPRPVKDQAPSAAAVVLPAAANRLGMSVRRADSSWEVQWDASRLAALGAHSGLLQVIDGDRRVDIPLSPAQLTQGKVVYVPKSDDLELVLSASTGAGVVQDSVRVIGSPVARPVDGGSRARAFNPPAPAPTAPAASPVVERPQTIEAPLAAAPPAPKPDLEPAMTAQLQPPQQQPITLRIETAPAPRAASPPAATPVQEPPAPQQAVVPPAQQQAPVALSRVLSQPILLNKVAPVVPPHLRGVMPSNATVDVQLRLGADGQVLSATAAPASGVMAHLTRVAIDAAKRWRFEPAKLDGRPVESDHKVTFRFGK